MENILFEYKFLPAKEYNYRVEINGSMNVDTPMGRMENPIEIKLTIGQKIIDVKNDLGIIEVVIKYAKAGKCMGQVPLPEIGKASKMSMTNSGKVVWLGDGPGWQGAEYSQMQFPEKEITKGDSWFQVSEATAGSAEPLKTRYTYTGMDKQIAAFVSEMFTGQYMGHGFQLIGKGSFTFEFEEGWILQTRNRLNHTYKMPVPDNPGLLMTTETVLDIAMYRI